MGHIQKLGFTLIELMIVVAIIGMLAAIGIPEFTRYIRRSKTTEARLLIRKIYDGELAYFDIDHVDRAGSHVSAQFVSAGPQPQIVPSGEKVLGNWAGEEWADLKFSTDGPVLYRYQAVSSSAGTGASFTARAEGDLDGDGTTSLYERSASVDTNGNVVGGTGIYVANDIE